ncbi:MAG: hypothetical protein MUF64_28485 [Polyangiaceae bacterium]|jgi:hypothetical protein|nr:hypothetical protein [Polyangiaceae bacterium]
MRSTSLKVALLGLVLLCAGCDDRKNVKEKPISPVPGHPDDTPAWSNARILPPETFAQESAYKGLFWSLLLPLGGVAGWAAFWERRHRRLARRERALAKGETLQGGETMIHGRVKTGGGDGITVEITQKKSVSQSKSGQARVHWGETRRKVIVRPFEVVLPDRSTVRVEADRRVWLRDKVEQPHEVDAEHRLRKVRLRSGEPVWVTGHLSGVAGPRSGSAYREATTQAVMKPPRFGRMVVSTEPPGAYFKEQAGFHRSWKRGVMITALILQTIFFSFFTLQALSGRTITAEVEGIRTWQVWVKSKNSPGRWVQHFAVDARAIPGAPPREFEVSADFYRCVEKGDCQTVPITRAWLAFNQLQHVGRGPQAHLFQFLFCGLIAWLAVLFYWLSNRWSRPWYAGGKVDDAG